MHLNTEKESERTNCYSERCGLQCVRVEMKLLCLEIVMLMARVTSAFPTEAAERYVMEDTGRRCLRCPPGQYQVNCNECSVCPDGSYTSQWNSEESCLHCNRDCRKEFNLQVVQECSPVADVLCSCLGGFVCADYDPAMLRCQYCVLGTPSTAPPALSKNQTESSETICEAGASLNVSSGNCDLQTNSESTIDTPYHSPETADRQLLWWVVLVVLVVSLIAPAIFAWRRREGTCLKRLFKLCSDGGHKGEDEAAVDQPGVAAGQLFSTEAHWNANTLTNPSKENHIDLPISIDQGPKATGNLGPFHIYSAGAVFVSLLNHFTSPEGDTEGPGRPQKEEGPPPPSPPIHLSEEERDVEKDCIFFPLQEQGKESHLSKEEEIYWQQKK